MSVKAVDAVLDHSQSRLGQRLTLVAIADEADNSGVGWPSVDRIAERSGLSRRQVQRALKDLIEMGELERRLTHPNGPWPVYRIILPGLREVGKDHPGWPLEEAANMTPPRGDKSDTRG